MLDIESRAPSELHTGNLFEDSQRAVAERRQFVESSFFYGHDVPHGNDEPLLMTAGFGQTRHDLQIPDEFFSRIGYRTINADVFPNMVTTVDVWRTEQLLINEFRKNQQPVIGIGISAGAIIQRILAFKYPEMFQHLISLVGPIGKDERGNEYPPARALTNWQRITDLMTTFSTDVPVNISDPLPNHLRSTQIYVTTDPIVNPQLCMDPNPGADNRWVYGSHFGAFTNLQAMGQVVDVLHGVSTKAA